MTQSRFWIDKQPGGWRWYTCAAVGCGFDRQAGGFKTRKEALDDARAQLA